MFVIVQPLHLFLILLFGLALRVILERPGLRENEKEI
jgi:hypothetical protein